MHRSVEIFIYYKKNKSRVFDNGISIENIHNENKKGLVFILSENYYLFCKCRIVKVMSLEYDFP
jgi:hypothetical protein